MALTLFTKAVTYVRSLANQTKSQPDTVKLTMDQFAIDMKEYVSESLIPEVEAQFATKQELLNAEIGTIPGGSVTNTYLATDVKVGSLATLTTTEKGSVTGAVNEVNTNLSTTQTNLDIIRLAKPSTGTANALAVDTAGTFDLTKTGNVLTVIPNLTNTSSATIAVDGQAAKAIKKFNVDTDAYIDIEANDLKKNTPKQLTWSLANDFFILAPSGGSSIKSIQSGLYSFSGTTLTADITLTSVDLTKAVVLLEVVNYASVSYQSANHIATKAVLTNATTLTLTRSYGVSAQQNRVRWKVIEFNNVKSKQTGSFTMTAANATTNITITPVNVSKSIAFVSSNSPSTTVFSQNSQCGLVSDYNISSSTNLAVLSNYAISATDVGNVHWQIIEFI